MARNENLTEFPVKPKSKKYGKGLGLHPLHEAALKLAGMGRNRPQGKTRDLVQMLLAHGARAWRGNQPKAELHLHVRSPAGQHPLRLRLR